MTKKGKRMRNPTYVAGVKKGVEISLIAINESLAELENEKGIGKVTRQKIQKALDSAYGKIKL